MKTIVVSGRYRLLPPSFLFLVPHPLPLDLPRCNNLAGGRILGIIQRDPFHCQFVTYAIGFFEVLGLAGNEPCANECFYFGGIKRDVEMGAGKMLLARE